MTYTNRVNKQEPERNNNNNKNNDDDDNEETQIYRFKLNLSFYLFNRPINRVKEKLVKGNFDFNIKRQKKGGGGVKFFFFLGRQPELEKNWEEKKPAKILISPLSLPLLI